MPEGRPPKDDEAALRARLDALSSKIKAQRPDVIAPAPGAAPQGGGSTSAAMSMAMKAGSEFVAAIIVGGAIGLGLDWLFHTKPAFTIVFFLLGVISGVWNIIRATSPKGSPADRNSPLSDTKAEDKDVPRGPPTGGGWDED